MGRSIQYYEFNENIGKDAISSRVNEDAIYASEFRKPLPNRLRFLDREIYKNESEAHKAIEASDSGAYDQIAVKFYHYERRKETKHIENIRSRLNKAIESLSLYRSKNSIKNRKSEFVGCSNCGSRINKKFISDDVYDWNTCPLCSENLSSKTVNKTIESKEDKISKIKKDLDTAIKNNNKKSKPEVKWLVKTEYRS